MSDARRALPSVGALLESEGVRALLQSAPRSLVVDAVRATVAQARETAAVPSDDAGWTAAVAERLADASRPSLRRVLNATGIVLHTNLGRAPLADVALEAIAGIAGGYSNLEFDLDARHARLALRALRRRSCASSPAPRTRSSSTTARPRSCSPSTRSPTGREAILSRGELVEIGGSFRVHEIMAKSGARLREVGATNRTHLADYERALGPDTGRAPQGASQQLRRHGLHRRSDRRRARAGRRTRRHPDPARSRQRAARLARGHRT